MDIRSILQKLDEYEDSWAYTHNNRSQNRSQHQPSQEDNINQIIKQLEDLYTRLQQATIKEDKKIEALLLQELENVANKSSFVNRAKGVASRAGSALGRLAAPAAAGLGAYDAVKHVQAGDYTKAALSAAPGIACMIPGVGWVSCLSLVAGAEAANFAYDNLIKSAVAKVSNDTDNEPQSQGYPQATAYSQDDSNDSEPQAAISSQNDSNNVELDDFDVDSSYTGRQVRNPSKYLKLKSKLGIDDNSTVLDNSAMNAIARFQKEKGITVDGLPGPETYSAANIIEDITLRDSINIVKEASSADIVQQVFSSGQPLKIKKGNTVYYLYANGRLEKESPQQTESAASLARAARNARKQFASNRDAKRAADETPPVHRWTDTVQHSRSPQTSHVTPPAANTSYTTRNTRNTPNDWKQPQNSADIVRPSLAAGATAGTVGYGVSSRQDSSSNVQRVPQETIEQYEGRRISNTHRYELLKRAIGVDSPGNTLTREVMEAIYEFQSKNGIKPTGVPGPHTYRAALSGELQENLAGAAFRGAKNAISKFRNRHRPIKGMPPAQSTPVNPQVRAQNQDRRIDAALGVVAGATGAHLAHTRQKNQQGSAQAAPSQPQSAAPASPAQSSPAQPSKAQSSPAQPSKAQSRPTQSKPAVSRPSPEIVSIGHEAGDLFRVAKQYKDARVRNAMERLDMALARIPGLDWRAASWLR